MKTRYWKDAKSVLKTYLLIIIPFMGIAFFMYNYLYNTEIDKTKQIIIEEQKQKTTIINYVIEDVFAKMHEELLVAKNSNEMADYLNDPTKENLEEVEKLFVRLTLSIKSFDQMRLINNSGQEIIRINNSEEGLEMVEKDLLQDKSDRYYYIETSQLSEGEIYVSNMDLNVENGEIEQPYKPMIRMATPLYTNDNVYQGILIINYLGQNILDVFTEYFQGDDDKENLIQPFLINDQGCYLYHNDQDKTFGFMFDNKASMNLQQENPGLWEDILLKHNGVFEENNVVNYYMSLNPLAKIDTTANTHYHWFIISTFDLKYLPSIQDNIIFGMKKIDILTIIGIDILILLVVMINYYSRKNKEQLNITTKIAENTNDAVIITDDKTRIIYANAAFEKATQYKPEEVIGLKPSFFKSNKQSKNFYKEMWDDITHNGYWHGELWDRKKDGLLYPKKLSIYKTKDQFSKQTRYIGIFSDMSGIKERDNHLEKLKNYNFDTNLPNENLMIRLINNSIEYNSKLYIVYFTIENYNQLMLETKESNKFVKLLTDRIKLNIKQEDFIAQVTKSDFVMGVSSVDSTQQFKTFIQAFIDKDKQAVMYNNKEMYFDLKAGVSIYPDDADDANNLITNAYLALEHVLNTKEKKYEYYQPFFKEVIQKELEIKRLLRKAIQNREFEVYYQPQIRIKDQKMVGAEALIRWNSKELGFVSPSVFIPLTENTGQIIDIGYWLIEQVILDYKKIKQHVDEEFRVSINISPVQFRDEKLIEQFIKLIDQYNVNPKKFEIELTEGVFVKDFNFVNDKLNQFKKLGMTIAIDDFGTGFSSLSYLKELNIDKLKIDRSFIKDYPNTDNGVMAQIITNMANKLGFKVITEGAETVEQIKYLESIGCPLIQGYYYSQPLSMKQFTAYVLAATSQE